MNAGVSKQAGVEIPHGQEFCLNKDKSYLLSSTGSCGIVCKVMEAKLLTGKPSFHLTVSLPGFEFEYQVADKYTSIARLIL